MLASVAALGIWRLLAVAAPHLAALALMYETETDFGSRLSFVLAWGILNFFWITLLRRPALSGALSLTMVVVLVLLSRLKHDVVQMTVNFIDLMMIDRDTVAFLFTIFPNLRWSVIRAGLVTLPLMYALWWLDPFRIRRLPAFGLHARLSRRAGRLFALSSGRGLARLLRRRLSSRSSSAPASARSPTSSQYGFMESAASTNERLNMPLVDACHPAGRRPNIIMIHDESSFDIRAAQGIKVPAALWQPLQIL